MKLSKKLFVGVAVIAIASASALASPVKGKKLYMKKLNGPCGFNGAVMAKKHTQDEWKTIFDGGKLEDEIKKHCKVDSVKEKYLPHLYHFFYKYASDSGEVPSC